MLQLKNRVIKTKNKKIKLSNYFTASKLRLKTATLYYKVGNAFLQF
jgi:hypothetical protein